ncbi:hypothetical protein SAICODRAFT_91567 [Saitoella complicata NRRL Y-17804]|uniref:Endonuclease n=1 Tax=Saitoella complicata (strain BCRC 22490 / CBS 7301 / JCM 7358 / NBRC 10748 / NRRL Y-17804) TaxID=698492 RepID=A0A0E9NM53_SAICN|nr:uncharacterized protein SAICODRAFT_91567 [Saitoella complicata NRRL Y-17804]ODQ53688.1 hypothetical protein SAICODRAFT_91567 [Saitoella complicata NRRL Y-17804]GAO50868.1 hypothetical protein G7K_4987-t1 [Saitoella complicata NRRL Y-17804]
MSRVVGSVGLVLAGAVAGGGVVYAASQSRVPAVPAAAPQPPSLPVPHGSPAARPSDVPPTAPAPVNPSGFLAFGFPGPVCDQAVRTGFISSYDRRMRNPAWVAEHITKESLAQRGGDRKNSAFKEDESIPEKFRARLQDYFRSGYDRGHQVPAADVKFSQAAMDETFYLSNMSPQVGDGFNRDYWAHFEDFCRRLANQYENVRIVTGPLYLPRKYPDGKWRVSYEVIGNPPNVAVPTHFYKVIVADNGNPQETVTIGSFVLPNAPIDNATNLTEFVTPLDAIERASGLEFLTALKSSKRRELCQETSCSVIVRQFADKNKQTKRLPAPKL